MAQPNLFGGVGSGEYGPPSPVSAVPAGTNSFNFNLGGLKDLQTEITKVINLFDRLDTKIKGVNAKLGGVSTGISGAGAGAGNLTTAAVSFAGGGGGATVQAAGIGAGGQGRGSTITAAGFGGRAIGYAAGAEVLAQAGGYINQRMGAIQQGGVPVQLAGAQMATISGGSAYQAVQGWNGVLNTGQADQAAAMQMQLQNSFLGGVSPRSKNFNNLRGFLNATQRLGGVSAQSGMSLLNALTSNRATQFFSQYTGGRGGAYDPRTGQLRSPQQAFQTTLQAAIPGSMGLSGAALAARFRGAATGRGGESWAGAAQNLAMAGLNPQQIALMREVAARGGNVGSATGGPISGTVAQSLLNRTTAGTATANQIMQDTSGLQNTINRLATDFQKIAQTVPAPLFQIGGAAAFAAKTLTMAGAQFLAASALMRGAGIGGAGGGLLARAGLGGAGGMLGRLGLAGGLYAGGHLAGSLAAGGQTTGSRALAGSMLSAAGSGAAIGTMIDPGLGTAIGAGVGAIGGAVEHFTGIHIPFLGDPSSTSGMQPNLAHGLTAMRAANPNIQINSGYRSQSQQAALYAAKGGQGVARPGQSPHQLGKAADLGPPSQFAWIAQNARRFGLATDRSEPWHVQAIGDPVSSPVGGLSFGRVDQGVDFSGAGTVNAVGAGTIVRVTTSGWGSLGNAGLGACIVLKLDKPPDVRHSMVYYAENIIPSVKVGQHVSAGQVLGQATGKGGGIEIGWSSTSNPGSPLAPLDPSNTGAATSEGQNFAAWLKGAVASSGTTAQTAVSATGSNMGTAVTGVGSKGAAGSLANTFIGKLSTSWLNGGGTAGAGVVRTATTSSTSGGASQSTTTTTAPASGGGNSSVVAAVKSVTSNRNVQIAMLTGSALESNQSNTASGGGAYGAWQIQSGQGVSVAQAEDPNFAAKWMVGRYTSGVGGVPSALWKTNPAMAAEQAAYAAERPAAPYIQTQGAGRVNSAYALAVSEVGGPIGDPLGGFTPSGVGGPMGGAGPVSSMRGGGRGITVNIGPLYVQGNQADANNIASMISAAIKGNSDIQAMAGS